MKIGVIGGAGVRTVIFINGLLKRYRRLNIDEVVLYDIDQEKLDIIGRLCRYVAVRNDPEKPTGLTVRTVERPEDAIRGMDYIVTTLRVGGDHSRVVDEQMSLKHGVIGQETTGFGGFCMAMRTIPVLLEYAKMIRNLAPEAWVFNFTNPSGLVTQALHTAGFHRVIGICDAPSSTKYRMAQKLGVAEEDLYVEFFGLNHLSWIRSVKVRPGALPESEPASRSEEGTVLRAEDQSGPAGAKPADVRAWKEILPELLADDSFLSSIQEFAIIDKNVLRSIGMLPNEYLYYYYHREKALGHISGAKLTRGQTIEQVNIAMMKELAAMDIDSDPEAALQTFLYYMQLRENSYMSIESGVADRPMLERGSLPVPEGMGYSGVMLDCIEGMQSREGRTLVLSVQNRGSIPFLSDEDVVEVTCLVSEEGISPVAVAMEDIPAHCELLIRLIKHYERMSVEALMTGDRAKAIEGLMVHPLVNSYSLACGLVEEFERTVGKVPAQSCD